MGSDIEAAVRDAFVAHMATVDVTDVKWLDEIGPVGERDNYAVLLATEWERFDAGYRAALARPAAPATAVEEARRAFYEAARAFCEEARIAVVTEMLGGRNMIEPTRNVAKPMLGAYDAMLAAEAAAKGGALG